MRLTCKPQGRCTTRSSGNPQYGTPYHALCNAVLAREGGGKEWSAYADRAVPGLEAALDHVRPRPPPTFPASTARRARWTDRTTGTSSGPRS